MVFFFFEVAVVEVALTTGNTLPQLTDPLRPVDICAHMSTVEKEGSMDVLAPILPLLNRTDVTSEVVKDRVALMFSYQPIQVIEHVLDT